MTEEAQLHGYWEEIIQVTGSALFRSAPLAKRIDSTTATAATRLSASFHSDLYFEKVPRKARDTFKDRTLGIEVTAQPLIRSVPRVTISGKSIEIYKILLQTNQTSFIKRYQQRKDIILAYRLTITIMNRSLDIKNKQEDQIVLLNIYRSSYTIILEFKKKIHFQIVENVGRLCLGKSMDIGQLFTILGVYINQRLMILIVQASCLLAEPCSSAPQHLSTHASGQNTNLAPT